MADLHLSDHVFVIRVDDDVVVLDVKTNTYSFIRDHRHSLVLDESDGLQRMEVSDEELGTALREAEMVLDGVGCRSSAGTRPTVGRPCSIPPPPLRLRDAIDMIGVLCMAPLHNLRPTLAPLLAYCARRRPYGPPNASEVFRRAAVFARLLIWSPLQGNCLFRSHLLLRFLRAGGCDADWVFAVRTWPFSAHCWLQFGDVVLNDAPEALRAFHPIMRV